MSGDANGRQEPVTLRTLDDKLATVRAEQKTEHTKTRALVVILAAPSVAKALPFVLGFFWWHPW